MVMHLSQNADSMMCDSHIQYNVHYLHMNGSVRPCLFNNKLETNSATITMTVQHTWTHIVLQITNALHLSHGMEEGGL